MKPEALLSNIKIQYLSPENAVVFITKTNQLMLFREIIAAYY
jgi:hypothetical protein